MNTYRPDETWHRLLEWTYGQPPSERLATQILYAEGFTNISPSHPLGGKDGGKDATARKGPDLWIMAAYFPRGQQSFTDIKNKFDADLNGVASHNAVGIVFVTNQEMRLAERSELHNSAQSMNAQSEVFHLESIAAILDRPTMHALRKQFLYIDYNEGSVLKSIKDEMSELEQRLKAVQTGGNTFCYAMLYDFDVGNRLARQFAVIRVGENTLFDVRLRVVDMDTDKQIIELPWGEMSAPAEFRAGFSGLADNIYFRIFFHARNGQWHQDLMLKINVEQQFWQASTRVYATDGRTIRFQRDEFDIPPNDTDWKS